MTRPKTPFEAASYDLIKFRERRVAERRAAPRGTLDRRASHNGDNADGSASTQIKPSDESADSHSIREDDD